MVANPPMSGPTATATCGTPENCDESVALGCAAVVG